MASFERVTKKFQEDEIPEKAYHEVRSRLIPILQDSLQMNRVTVGRNLDGTLYSGFTTKFTNEKYPELTDEVYIGFQSFAVQRGNRIGVQEIVTDSNGIIHLDNTYIVMPDSLIRVTNNLTQLDHWLTRKDHDVASHVLDLIHDVNLDMQGKFNPQPTGK